MTAPAATPDNRKPSTKTPASYARSAVFAEFRRRDAAALDHGDFTDRQPNETPRRTRGGGKPRSKAREAGQHDHRQPAERGVIVLDGSKS